MNRRLLKFFDNYLGYESPDKLYLEFEGWFDRYDFKYRFPTKEEFAKAYNVYLQKHPELSEIKMVTTIYADRIEITNAEGKLHSFNDLPSRVWTSSFRQGTKEWHLNGMRHRLKGPALEKWDGTQVWCIRGKRENPFGPAVVNKKWCIHKYYIDDKFVTQEEHKTYYG